MEGEELLLINLESQGESPEHDNLRADMPEIGQAPLSNTLRELQEGDPGDRVDWQPETYPVTPRMPLCKREHGIHQLQTPYHHAKSVNDTSHHPNKNDEEDQYINADDDDDDDEYRSQDVDSDECNPYIDSPYPISVHYPPKFLDYDHNTELDETGGFMPQTESPYKYLEPGESNSHEESAEYQEVALRQRHHDVNIRSELKAYRSRSSRIHRNRNPSPFVLGDGEWPTPTPIFRRLHSNRLSSSVSDKRQRLGYEQKSFEAALFPSSLRVRKGVLPDEFPHLMYVPRSSKPETVTNPSRNSVVNDDETSTKHRRQNTSLNTSVPPVRLAQEPMFDHPFEDVSIESEGSAASLGAVDRKQVGSPQAKLGRKWALLSKGSRGLLRWVFAHKAGLSLFLNILLVALICWPPIINCLLSLICFATGSEITYVYSKPTIFNNTYQKVWNPEKFDMQMIFSKNPSQSITDAKILEHLRRIQAKQEQYRIENEKQLDHTAIKLDGLVRQFDKLQMTYLTLVDAEKIVGELVKLDGNVKGVQKKLAATKAERVRLVTTTIRAPLQFTTKTKILRLYTSTKFVIPDGFYSMATPPPLAKYDRTYTTHVRAEPTAVKEIVSEVLKALDPTRIERNGFWVHGGSDAGTVTVTRCNGNGNSGYAPAASDISRELDAIAREKARILTNLNYEADARVKELLNKKYGSQLSLESAVDRIIKKIDSVYHSSESQPSYNGKAGADSITKWFTWDKRHFNIQEIGENIALVTALLCPGESSCGSAEKTLKQRYQNCLQRKESAVHSLRNYMGMRHFLQNLENQIPISLSFTLGILAIFMAPRLAKIRLSNLGVLRNNLPTTQINLKYLCPVMLLGVIGLIWLRQQLSARLNFVIDRTPGIEVPSMTTIMTWLKLFFFISMGLSVAAGVIIVLQSEILWKMTVFFCDWVKKKIHLCRVRSEWEKRLQQNVDEHKERQGIQELEEVAGFDRDRVRESPKPNQGIFDKPSPTNIHTSRGILPRGYGKLLDTGLRWILSCIQTTIARIGTVTQATLLQTFALTRRLIISVASSFWSGSHIVTAFVVRIFSTLKTLSFPSFRMSAPILPSLRLPTQVPALQLPAPATWLTRRDWNSWLLWVTFKPATVSRQNYEPKARIESTENLLLDSAKNSPDKFQKQTPPSSSENTPRPSPSRSTPIIKSDREVWEDEQFERVADFQSMPDCNISNKWLDSDPFVPHSPSELNLEVPIHRLDLLNSYCSPSFNPKAPTSVDSAFEASQEYPRAKVREGASSTSRPSSAGSIRSTISRRSSIASIGSDILRPTSASSARSVRRGPNSRSTPSYMRNTNAAQFRSEVSRPNSAASTRSDISRVDSSLPSYMRNTSASESRAEMNPIGRIPTPTNEPVGRTSARRSNTRRRPLSALKGSDGRDKQQIDRNDTSTPTRYTSLAMSSPKPDSLPNELGRFSEDTILSRYSPSNRIFFIEPCGGEHEE